MIYRIGMPLVRTAIQQYFSAITQKGAAPVLDGPLLIAANHPNCALDPVLVACSFRRPLWFMAKSTLFRGKLLSTMLEQCHMIPVYRRQDSASGTVDNSASFKRGIDVLKRGDALAIFPEGVSLGERKLMPIKTGAARIALQTMAETGFEIDLKIQPIGITYTDLRQFKSAVTLYIGEPIAIKPLRERYAADPDQTVRDLTEEIETRLKAQTVEVSESRHVELVEKIGKVYQSRGNRLDDFERLNLIARNVEMVEPHLSGERERLESQIDAYLSLLSVFHLNGGVPIEFKYGALLSLLLAPLICIGAVLSYPPYELIAILISRFSYHPAVDASYKFGLGLLLFPMWYVLLAVLVGIFTHSAGLACLALVFLGLCGYLVNHYLMSLRMHALSFLWPGQVKPLQVITLLGDSLIEELNNLKRID